MWKYFQKICVFLVISFIVNLFCFLIKSSFLIDFLKKDIVIIMTTLLAINITTTGIILLRLKELGDFEKLVVSVNKIKKSLRNAIKEQIILICLSVLILSISSSSYVNENISLYIFLNTLLVAIFINTIYILWDTAGAIFDLN
jgi:hypothetical protein